MRVARFEYFMNAPKKKKKKPGNGTHAYIQTCKPTQIIHMHVRCITDLGVSYSVSDFNERKKCMPHCMPQADR